MEKNDFKTTLRQFRDWGDTSLGRAFMTAEQEAQDELAAQMFGYHLLQIGQLGNQAELNGGQFRYRIQTSAIPNTDSDKSNLSSHIEAEPADLPIGSESMAAVSLGHVLEFHSNPHQVLREVDRVLVPDGYVLISGFNPLSSWGLWQIIRASRKGMPWSGRFLSLGRLKDWMGLLNMEVIGMHSFFIRPPVSGRAMLNRLQFMEKARPPGPLMNRTCLGAGYVVLARKRTMPLTPIRPRWQPKRELLGANVARPSTRDNAS